MDVDRIKASLTDDEKTQLMKEGKCFRCKKKGHMSRACPTHPNKPLTQRTRAALEEEEAEEEEDVGSPSGTTNVDQILASITSLSEEQREEFLEKAFSSEDF
jgi:DNA-directed RNA polymerase specialized sigma24 family protein